MVNETSETLKKRRNITSYNSSNEEKEKNSPSKSTNDINNRSVKQKSSGIIEKISSFFTKQSFLILFTLRTVSACFNLIWDCDEVYNYWEPLHFILFGDGFQTWEYSPVYSLRSYLYIFMHALPLMPFISLFEKITVFYLLRFIFALITSKIESYLFQSLQLLVKNHNEYEKISQYFLIFCFTNVGMFLSTTSFLPSTFSMYLVMLAYASWIRNRNKMAIFCIGFAVLVGWPFVIILGLPICIDLCFIKGNNKIANIMSFMAWTIVFGLVIAIPMVLIDSYMFGKFVFAPLNIVLYNVFPTNPNQGPDIYGKEPLSYYLKNGFLNLNFLFPMAYMSILFVCCDFFKMKLSLKQEKTINKPQNQKLTILINYCLMILGMFLWSLVFFTRPHKEERFLYPIYPMMLIGASYTLNSFQMNTRKVFNMLKLNFLWRIMPAFVIILHTILSVMRGVALIKNYSATIELYNLLNQPSIKFSTPWLENKEEINVCVSKEWHRFPSSFFIPEKLDLATKHQYWKLAFLESDFKGQLPGYFNRSLRLPESTRYVDKYFNDENKEVTQRYLNIKKCDFLIDTDDVEEDSNQKLFFNKINTTTKWKTLAKLKFLDAGNPKNNIFFRSFYVPYFYEKYLKFTFFKLRVQMK